MSLPFGARLAELSAQRSPLCLGIDPHPALLEAWGLEVGPRGVAEFSARALDAFGDLVSSIKPQVALYEEYGSAGLAVLERVLSDIRDRGALSIADAKRGDIGSTMAAYARAWLSDASPLAADSVTVSPYLGTGALEPVFDLAAETGRGVFVLARTSNPEATELQESLRADGRSVAKGIVDDVAARNAAQGAGGALGSFGVVVGATVASPPDLGALAGPVLLPGVGAQGATLADIAGFAHAASGSGAGTPGVPPLLLANVSREVLRQGPDVSRMRSAAEDLAARASTT